MLFPHKDILTAITPLEKMTGGNPPRESADVAAAGRANGTSAQWCVGTFKWHKHTGQTDRRTDRQTDGRNWRGINSAFFL